MSIENGFGPGNNEINNEKLKLRITVFVADIIQGVYDEYQVRQIMNQEGFDEKMEGLTQYVIENLKPIEKTILLKENFGSVAGDEDVHPLTNLVKKYIDENFLFMK